ncbi:MAG: outer membrane beta-barrel protein [Bacteroidetes bacterium]|nr:outer membrane beta-barrel protein [Bacteroidota bacterium]
MKLKRGLVLLTLLVFTSMRAQDSLLISRHRPGLFWFFDGLRPTKSTDNHKYDRLVFDLTYNDWSGDLKPFQNRWNSIGVNVNFMKDIKFKKTKVFSLGLGLGYGFSSISSEQKFAVQNNIITFSSIQKSNIYDYSSLKTHRFFMPLELRFSTKKWNRWKFAVGGSFGINIAMNQRMIGSGGSKMERTNLRPAASLLNYGLHTRLGYKNFSLFGSYQINSLFNGRGNPDLHLFQLGLSISLF